MASDQDNNTQVKCNLCTKYESVTADLTDFFLSYRIDRQIRYFITLFMEGIKWEMSV